MERPRAPEGPERWWREATVGSVAAALAALAVWALLRLGLWRLLAEFLEDLTWIYTESQKLVLRRRLRKASLHRRETLNPEELHTLLDSCSVSRLETESEVLIAQSLVKEKVVAKHASLSHLSGKLGDFAKELDCCSEQLAQTLEVCLELLTGTTAGGVILMVIDSVLFPQLPRDHVDGGRLYDVFRQEAPNIHTCRQAFECILDGFCRHSASDRWERDALEELGFLLGKESLESDQRLQELERQPADGALAISFEGVVLDAAVKLNTLQQRYFLQKQDGTGSGTRHAAALSTAVWLGNRGGRGIVFVRSDAGGLHCFFPRGGSEPPAAIMLGDVGIALKARVVLMKAVRTARTEVDSFRSHSRRIFHDVGGCGPRRSTSEGSVCVGR